MQQDHRADSPEDAPDEGIAFVLRCRLERPASDGEERLHFQLRQVGAEESWRFTELDAVFETLRARIMPLLRSGDTAN